MKKVIGSLSIILCVLFSLTTTAAEQVHVNGNVRSGSIPLCALVLINGQSEFSCEVPGSYEMFVPRDGNGLITVQVFVAGFAPYKRTITPGEANNVDIEMKRVTQGRPLQVNPSSALTGKGWATLSGTVSADGLPVCALVLANGQKMFSCNDDLGSFLLDIPLDADGNITLMVFAAGFEPYKLVMPTQNQPEPPIPVAEGLWIGETRRNQAISGLVLGDGSYYVLYSTEGNPSKIAGVVVGNSSMNGSSFTSNNARDFNLEGLGVLSANISATVATRETFVGSIAYEDGFINTFSAVYSNEYQRNPSLAELAGSFRGTVAFSQGFESASFAIAQDGTFSGSGASGCAVTGYAYPRTSGNVFNISLEFGGYPCFFANSIFTGIGYYETATRQFTVMTPNASRTDGILFVGKK